MPSPKPTFRILIASSHALFSNGLRSILENRWGTALEIVGMVSTIEEASQALASLKPNLLVVDYDDEMLNRDEILSNFIQGENDLRVVLLSLKSGKQGEEAIVYDRKTLIASRIEDWLHIDSKDLNPGAGDHL
jgi:DNA-binding NarL/FixJ family response regulator